MTAKEVYHKATEVDDESHEVSLMEDETQDTITNKNVKLKIKRKPMVFGHTSRLIVVKITKLFFLHLRIKLHGEEVSQLNLISATFVSI